MIGEAISSIVDGLRLWRERKHDSAQALKDRNAALLLIMEAVVATKAYLYELNEKGASLRDDEREPSQKWARASMAISEYDFELYNSAQLKAMDWADPREWKKADVRPWAIKLDVILEQIQWLQQNP